MPLIPMGIMSISTGETKMLLTMKRTLIFLCGGVLLSAAASCSVDNATPVPSDPRVQMEFTAGAPGTRTAISSDNSVIWSEGDAISIFDGTGNNRFDISDGYGTASAKFTGAAAETDKYYALYPYSADADLEGTTLHATLPTVQYAEENTFGTGLNPSVAVTDASRNLTFHNVAGILKVSLSGSNVDGRSISEIQIKPEAGNMAGPYTVAMDEATPAAAAASSGSPVGVQLKSRDGGAMSGTDFYLVLLPGTYQNVELTVICTDGSYMTGTSGTFTITAGEVNTTTVDLSDATANDQGLYGLYQAGIDIEIGGKTYTPEDLLNTFTNVIHITSDNAESTNLTSPGVYFIDPDVTVSNRATRGWNKVMLIGNDPSVRTKVDMSNYIAVTNDGGQFVCYNMEFADKRSSATYMFTSTFDGGYESVVFDNCKFSLLAGSALISVSSQSKGTVARYINNTTIVDSEISLPEYTRVGVDGKLNNPCRTVAFTATVSSDTGTSLLDGVTINSVTIRNNAIYCNSGMVNGYQLLFTTNNAECTVSSLSIENNSFVNLLPRTDGLISAYTVSSLDMRNNIFWTADMMDLNYVIVKCYGEYPAGEICKDNLAFATNAGKDFVTFHENNGWSGADNVIVTSESPFADMNYTDGIFTVKPEYASYGAQR